MVTQANVNMIGWVRQSSTPILDGNYPVSTRPAASFDVPFGANRVSGFAPLAVQFDAGFDASTVSEQHIHDYYYLWDYGDTGSGTWGINSKSRNRDTGIIGAHVFESPGTYNVGLTVLNASTGATIRTETVQVTVTDPDVFFTGTNTVCVNNVGDSDFTGAPSGATQVNSDDINSVMSTHLATGKRVLLKRGGSWSYSTTPVSGTISNAQIGAYGTGTSPDAQGLFSNAPTLTATAAVNFVDMGFKTNFRITDLEFTSGLTAGQCINGSWDYNNNIIMNCKFSGGGDGIILSNYRESDADTIDGNFIVNNQISGCDDYLFFAGGDRLCVLGNSFLNSTTSHVTRLWQVYKGVFNHNRAAGAAHGNQLGSHALKLQAPTDSQIGPYGAGDLGAGGLPHGTQYMCINDNEFGSSPPYPVSIEPQNATSNENLTDLTIERNSYRSDLGTWPGGVGTQEIYRLSGRFITTRNNIGFTDGMTDGCIGVNVHRRGIENTPQYHYVYNNTFASDDSIVWEWAGVQFTADTSNCIARNNLLHAPNATTETAANNSGTNNTLSNNLAGLTNPMVDPFNVTPASRDFSLAVSSGASNTGIAVPVYDDYAETQRTGSFDVGAYND